MFVSTEVFFSILAASKISKKTSTKFKAIPGQEQSRVTEHKGKSFCSQITITYYVFGMMNNLNVFPDVFITL